MSPVTARDATAQEENRRGNPAHTVRYHPAQPPQHSRAIELRLCRDATAGHLPPATRTPDPAAVQLAAGIQAPLISVVHRLHRRLLLWSRTKLWITGRLSLKAPRRVLTSSSPTSPSDCATARSGSSPQGATPACSPIMLGCYPTRRSPDAGRVERAGRTRPRWAPSATGVDQRTGAWSRVASPDMAPNPLVSPRWSEPSKQTFRCVSCSFDGRRQRKAWVGARPNTPPGTALGLVAGAVLLAGRIRSPTAGAEPVPGPVLTLRMVACRFPVSPVVVVATLVTPTLREGAIMRTSVRSLCHALSLSPLLF
jgi:hypothetical protein